jgi:hypothetical protein
VLELLAGKVRLAAAAAGAGDVAARKKIELCDEKIVALEAEISRLKLMLHARDGELHAAQDELQADPLISPASQSSFSNIHQAVRDQAAAAKGKEGDAVPAKDIEALRDELAAARSLCAAAQEQRDAAVRREGDQVLQFEELKRAFHAATEGAVVAAVAPEVVDKLKKEVEAAKLSEMSTRGELCLVREQVEAQEQKVQALQTQLQAEKQRGERVRREKEDVELANSCLKGEMSTMKRVTVNQDRWVVPLLLLLLLVVVVTCDSSALSYEAVLADELCCMREAYEAKLKERCGGPKLHLHLRLSNPQC